MRDPREVLEELTWLLEDLRDRPDDQVILVEGLKDRAALSVLGVGGEVWQVQGPNSIFSVAERLALEKKQAVILTDWDRKGGQLARLLRSSLTANSIHFDDHIRLRLVILVKKDIKDIESLPAFYSRLVGLSQNPAVLEKFNKLKRAKDLE